MSTPPRQGVSSDGSLYMKFNGILQNAPRSNRLWAGWRLRFWNELPRVYCSL